MLRIPSNGINFFVSINDKVGTLFYDAFSVTGLYSVDYRVIGERWIRKNFVESDRDLIVMYYLGIYLEGLRKQRRTLKG
jgi:hypothetical protein